MIIPWFILAIIVTVHIMSLLRRGYSTFFIVALWMQRIEAAQNACFLSFKEWIRIWKTNYQQERIELGNHPFWRE